MLIKRLEPAGIQVDIRPPLPILASAYPIADAQYSWINFGFRYGTGIQDLFHNLLTFVIAQREAIKLKNLAMRRKIYYDNRDNLNLMG